MVIKQFYHEPRVERSGLAVLALTAALTVPCLCAVGQVTFTVTSAADTGAGTLREALALADVDKKVDTIRFDASLAGATISLASPLRTDEEVHIEGAGAPGLTVSGGWDGVRYSTVGTRVFEFLDGAKPVFISDLRLARGNGGNSDDDGDNGPNDPISNGGLVFMAGDALTLTRVILTDAVAHDGGLLWHYAGDLTAADCVFAGGRARDDGGVMHQMASAKLWATNCTFYDNESGWGGPPAAAPHHGSVARLYGELSLEYCTVAYNRSPSGTFRNSGTMRISRNVFGNNDPGSGYENLNGSGSYEDFGGGSLEAADGNYSDNDVVGGINVLASDDLGLGTLYVDDSGVPACALSCGSALRAAISASGTDVRGVARPASGEPGAVVLGDCADLDGDGTADANGDDDLDGDGVDDVDEIAASRMDTVDFAALIGSGNLLPDGSYAVAGNTVTATTLSPNGVSTVRAFAGILGDRGGLRLYLDADRADQALVLRLDFATPVRGLAFTVSDLDEVSTSRHERVGLVAYAGDEPVHAGTADVALETNAARRGQLLYPLTNSSVNGTIDIAGSATVGPLPSGVTRLELHYRHGPVSGNPGNQTVYLANLSWLADLDGDGLAATVDLDADGDGVPDLIEAQASAAYSASATSVTPVDTDSDGAPDFLDLDSDDDGELDLVEAHDTNGDGVVSAASDTPIFGSGEALGVDADADGIDDGFDNTVGIFGNGGEPAALGGFPENNTVEPELDFRDGDDNVAGFAWWDVNEDGIRQDTEQVFQNVTVDIFGSGNDYLVASATTDAEGRFLVSDFDGFGHGGNTSFYAVFGPPPGYAQVSGQDLGGDDRLDSDIDPVTYRTAAFTVSDAAPQPFLGAGFSAAPLPVRLLELGAERAAVDGNACKAIVRWRVADERNVAYYELEVRRPDGTFRPVATEDANGGPAYEVTLGGLSGEIYLRLLSVDADGSAVGSPAVRLPACRQNGSPVGGSAIRLTPNVAEAGGAVRFALGTFVEARELVVVDPAGRTVARAPVGRNGAGTLDTSGLRAGLYVVRAGRASMRLLVQ